MVVNCVAERRPDRVEQDEPHARRLNVDLVARLAEEAAHMGFRLVHISTDYVFDGSSPPYGPDAAPRPLNAYGRHKLEAEEAIRQVRACIRMRMRMRMRMWVCFGVYVCNSFTGANKS